MKINAVDSMGFHGVSWAQGNPKKVGKINVSALRLGPKSPGHEKEDSIPGVTTILSPQVQQTLMPILNTP